MRYKVLGIMSGTSFDGIDLCLAEFKMENQSWNHEIIQAKTYSYTDHLRQKILAIENAPGTELVQLHHEYGNYLGTLAHEFLNENQLSADLIASHGHTLFHQPELGFTFQLGHGASIAAASKITTISDFRSLDVALGGEGAPLVPFGDKHLFNEYDCCINIGGIANISYQEREVSRAFDIAPANMVINALYQSSGGTGEFDKGGEAGRRGSFDNTLFHQLNELDYYHKSLPKSLGKEWVMEHVFPIFSRSTVSEIDQLHTYYKHLAFQIEQSLPGGNPSVLITGGGANNTFLIDLIKASNAQIEVPDQLLIEFKEALIFAFLGLRRFLGKVNTLKTVTGASRDSSGGTIYSP